MILNVQHFEMLQFACPFCLHCARLFVFLACLLNLGSLGVLRFRTYGFMCLCCDFVICICLNCGNSDICPGLPHFNLHSKLSTLYYLLLPPCTLVRQGVPRKTCSIVQAIILKFPRTCAGIAIGSRAGDIENDTHDIRIEHGRSQKKQFNVITS